MMSTLTEGKDEISRVERILEYVMLRYRWIFVIIFLLPLSVLNDAYFSIRNYIIFKIQSAPKAHNRKVAVIQRQVREWNDTGRVQKMCTARSGWLSMSFRFPLYKKQMKQISTDTLVDILEIDTEARTIRVEPMVTMGQITRTLIPLGYTLPIVPELDDLTVGGMINGCGVESSGRKYGLFQHICVSYEVVLSDGSLITASKGTENAEHQGLFYGIPWSHGTLGFVVAATIRIIPCQPYVKLTYIPVNSLQEMQDTLELESKTPENEFVEGIQFNQNSGVVMRGRFCETPSNTNAINRIGNWHKPWFYTHVESILNNGEEKTEYIPLRDYYHRHSKSIFWEIKEIIPFGNNVIFRWLLGWACPPKISLLKATTPPTLRRMYDRHHVLQDMLVPLSTLKKCVQLFDKEVQIYPIWLCPFNLPTCPGLVKQKSGENVLYVDVGVYGVTNVPTYDARETGRRIEQFVRQIKGVQMLYADTYMTREEFWEMFDSSLYEWLRVKFNAKQAFPDVYDKVCREARY